MHFIVFRIYNVFLRVGARFF